MKILTTETYSSSRRIFVIDAEPKLSVRSQARDASREERRAKRAAGQSAIDGGWGSLTADSFQNFAAGLGLGTDNLMSASTYGFNPITRIRILMEWIYRGSWLGAAVVNRPANDMTRQGAEVKGELDPDAIKRLEAEISRLKIWNRHNEAIRWGRLYGGAIAVILKRA